jgi:hypothetical protein
VPESATCPRRTDEWGPWDHSEGQDHWREDRTCSFCGSLHPDNVMRHIRDGVQLDPTDKNYKGYLMVPNPKVGQRRITGMSNHSQEGGGWVQITEAHLPELNADGWNVDETDIGHWMLYGLEEALSQVKFYFQHFSAEQRRELIQLCNDSKVRFGHPGHFYVLPFFMKREGAVL